MKAAHVLDLGYIRLKDVMGDDARIVRMARTSHNLQDKEVKEKDLKLINHLMKLSHGTPFEMVVFTFDVKCPIFVARELFRHRIASYNEMSARYTELEPDFYIPETYNIRKQVDKKIKYKFEPVELNVAYTAQSIFHTTYEQTWKAYQEMLHNGIAKEVARMVLPVGIYTKFGWTINLRSLFNFIQLRSHETAMFEIRQYSQAIEKIIEPIVPVAYKAFVDNGRIAP